MASTERGFTLIEIMITVAIIGILAAIAIPNYRDYVTRGRIVQASSGMSDARIRTEQYFQDNRAYPTACKTSAPGATEILVQSPEFFDITCTLAAQTYTVTATGNGGMAGFTYTIDNTGLKTSAFSGSGASAGWTAASPNNCWVIRKGAMC